MHNHINGRWVDGQGEALSVTCPATCRKVWEGNAASRAQVEAACVAARSAFARWARTKPAERVEIVVKFKEVVLRQADTLARAISEEVGKPLWESRAEVASIAAKIDVSLRAQGERAGERFSASPDGRALLSHRPHGVLAVLGPFNFPGHLPNGHIVPALLAGNTIVFKPSEFAPGVGLLIARCWQDAGLPAGVLNVINGGHGVGEALTAHAQCDGVLFTGSYSTGLALSRRFAGSPEKMLALEMGGNNPLVVWGVSDLRAAAVAIVQSAFISAGQRCTCARRLIVQDGRPGSELLEEVSRLAAALRIGAWNDSPQPFMGPVVSQRAAESLLLAQRKLIASGALPLLEMRSLRAQTGFVTPAILDVSTVAKSADEELFGPLLQVTRVQDFDAAIVSANQTAFGLAAGLLSDDEAHWQRFWSGVRAGVINWNRPTTGASSSAPFGGVGRSGNHRASAYYAADYCAYPVAGMAVDRVAMPAVEVPGLPVEW
jgi:succinylglutamic semialdehyde dehydrogenase